MSRQLFSLIQQDKIELAPGKKHLPAEDFSILLEAQELLKKTQEDAEAYQKRIITQCETIKEQAKQEGFEEGFRQWVKEVANLEQVIVNLKKETEKMVLPIALKAAKKIVAKELEVSETAIIDIITQTLRPVAQHKRITIQVNPEEFETVEKKRKDIKGIFENLEALSIRPNNEVQKGGCIIETEGGIINAQLDNQWKILENAFARLAKQREDTP